MLEMSERILKQGYKIITTKVKGTNKFKGLCTRRDSNIYELPEKELYFLSSLPNINEILEDGGIMISSMQGYSFHTEIGASKEDTTLFDTDNLDVYAMEESRSYCESLIDLNANLGEKKMEVKKPVSAQQYVKVHKGGN